MLVKISKLILLVFIIVNTSSCASKKSIKVSLPDPNLPDSNFIKAEWENIFGYKKNKYLLLYGNNITWLYDMEGNELKKWTTDTKRSQLLKNCNLMIVDNNDNNDIRELDSDSKLVWNYAVKGFAHHDFEISENGNITFLQSTTLPKDFPLQNGCKHEEVISDRITEVSRSKEVIFEWVFHEHYEEVINRDKCNKNRRKHMAKSGFTHLLDSIHPNAINVLGDNKWYRQGYDEFKPGNILVTLHHLDQIILINKTDKEIIWTYQGVESPLEGPHEAKMIPRGLPGAGNILIFDNGIRRKFTKIIEINPITKKTIWEYSSPGEFFSRHAGSHQRLKNGDTFISDDGSGRVFIVDKKGNTKWQFRRKYNTWVKRASLYSRKDFAHCLQN